MSVFPCVRLPKAAAALAAGGATKEEAKVDLNDDFWGTGLKPGEVWTMEDELEAMAHDTEMKSARQAIAEGTDEKQTELEEGEVVIKTIAPDDFFDQHTRIFLPVSRWQNVFFYIYFFLLVSQPQIKNKTKLNGRIFFFQTCRINSRGSRLLLKKEKHGEVTPARSNQRRNIKTQNINIVFGGCRASAVFFPLFS